MNIKFEQADTTDIEVTIKGDINNPKLSTLISYINSLDSSVPKILCISNEQEYLIDLSDIMYFSSNGNKTLAYCREKSYEVRSKLYELEQTYLSRGFIRISKSSLVNIDSVLCVEAEFSGNYIANLKDTKTRLTISRKYVKDFKNYILKGLDL